MKYIPRVLRYLRPYWHLAMVSVGLIALSALAGLLAPWPLQFLIDKGMDVRLGKDPKSELTREMVIYQMKMYFAMLELCKQFGLDFIRLLTEDYFFVCKRAFLETEPMRRVLDIMKGREFQEGVASLPGYVATSTGTVHTVKEFLESAGSNAT